MSSPCQIRERRFADEARRRNGGRVALLCDAVGVCDALWLNLPRAADLRPWALVSAHPGLGAGPDLRSASADAVTSSIRVQQGDSEIHEGFVRLGVCVWMLAPFILKPQADNSLSSYVPTEKTPLTLVNPNKFCPLRDFRRRRRASRSV
ncbi:unnamed protein product [Leuciscus chuanchicus]